MSDVLQTKDLTLSYGERTIIDELNIDIPQGEISVFIGGNGCGKSTLLRSIARLLKPKQGSVLLDGEAISRLSTKEVARKMAILPQSPTAPEGLTVLQLVKQGRYPHQTWLKQWSQKDEEIVQDALKATKMEDLQHRKVDELSGGQRQRAWIALTLAQDTDIILLDEPTTYLDMTHQIEILDLLFELNEKEQRTIVMVLHDLNLACRYAHNIVAIRDKQIYAQGKPEEVISCELVKNVFDMDCQVSRDPLFGTPLCIPFGKGRCILKDAVETG
ncbi:MULTISPECIES: ABC transporter ATP-binding protein [Rossellomorea]|jgi:iron complex transport system ATP-binding protein|uniref:ATP-binding cassette domain-containing protein n=1 Tax=Rossellomorea vietnamensis TaxID=218284 RepID=A0A6I6UM19_9BACI|nr:MULTISPECIES: ABC transporter ATP-binding protein [Rossellomorea]MCA0150729.1 ABC transporter ATP-binding protein [Rossellomorea vietnamensis]MCC5801974.1 ABC transporter ATP-binding protein [Rossellomorea vietnamensis]QHE63018.1 ATP-binding cassette domain-containing protein [Rossellomorea vietnamensis]WGG45066.1 ABC transporter ATP-binding protein [Rossellomorea sp. DA94]